jgi:chemotaxis protein methyltransferase CheR
MLPDQSSQPVRQAAFSAKAYRTIVNLVYEHSRIKLGDDKETLLTNRLGKRLRILGLSSYDDYCEILRSPDAGGELEHLVDLISTNHTRFFREPDHFTFLTQRILPALLPHLIEAGTPLRVWSAASSSGEEPYTLAIVLSEYLRAYPSVTWQIEASDISSRMLHHASRGIYRLDAVDPVPRELLERYFQKGVGEQEGNCRVRDEIRRKVRYERVNLFQQDYPVSSQQHVIFCRNVMIYFDLPSRELAVRKLTQHLAPGGCLIVGHSESLMGIRHGLQPLKQGVYQKP